MKRDPRRCGAHARTTGKPCRRWTLLEEPRRRAHRASAPAAEDRRPRCALHGGKTPSKRGRDLERARTQRIAHGARTSLGTVLALAEQDAPGILARLLRALPEDGRTDLSAEIVLARQLLALTCIVGAHHRVDLLGPQHRCLELVRQLVVAQARGGRGAGIASTALELVVRVVEPRLAPEERARLAPVLELRRPVQVAEDRPRRHRRAA